MNTAFFDVDTQLDFLYPAGALYVPGAEKRVSNIAALNRFAVARGIPLISTMDAHAENDPEFRVWPPHCIAGTLGQQKAAATLMEKPLRIANHTAMPELAGARQFLVEKQVNDCFTNTNLAGLLTYLDAEHFVVYGVVTEICVRHAVEGLIHAGKRVALVDDAIQHLDVSAARQLTEFVGSHGGAVFSAASIMSTTIFRAAM